MSRLIMTLALVTCSAMGPAQATTRPSGPLAHDLAALPATGWLANGKGGTHGGTPLTNALTREAITTIVVVGRNQMSAFGSALSAQVREDLATDVLELVK